jgi:uncharacterized protein (DUF4415 family)
MSKERIVRYTGKEIEEMIRSGQDKTDWARVETMTDEDIERAIADDPDWADFRKIDWSKAKMVNSEVKNSTSVTIDKDVIDFFQAAGKGYQARINAVLKDYVAEQKRSKK